MTVVGKNRAKKDLIASVLRGLSILELLAAHPEGLNPKQIAFKRQFHLSTCYHLLNTLETAGYVVKNPSTQLFQLSGKIGYTVHDTASPAQLVKHLSPHVHALQEATFETAYLSLWYQNEVVLSSIAESPLSVRVKALTIGYAEAAHAMALGKAILAYLPEAIVDEYLSRHGLPRLTGNTITDLPTLKTHLAEIKKQAYSIDHEEFLPDVYCIGAPVFDAQQHITGAIAISVPATRYRSQAETLLPKVLEAGRTATRALKILGYIRP
jgi:DNA-binding IclR family transcriptional regulator